MVPCIQGSVAVKKMQLAVDSDEVDVLQKSFQELCEVFENISAEIDRLVSENEVMAA